MTDGTTRVKPKGGEITSNIFILFGKARENKCTAKDREGGQVEVSFTTSLLNVVNSSYPMTKHYMFESSELCWQ